MAKKKGKKALGPAAPPMAGDLMSELLGQLLSSPAEPTGPAAAEMLDAGELEAELPPAAEDSLAVLSAAMDEAAPVESQASSEIEPQSLLAIAEVAGSEPEPTPAVADLPVAEPPVPMELAEPEATPEPVPDAVPARPEASPEQVPVAQAAAEAEPAAEPVAEAVVEESVQPAPEAAAPESVDEDLPAPASLPQPVPETASRLLRSRHHQSTLAEGGLLDSLIGAIDSEIARSPLTGSDGADSEEAESGPVETCAVFTLGGAAYGVPVQNIVEIDQAGEVTPVPNVPEFVRGVINLRGEIMCVLDLSAFIGQAPLPEDHSGWFLVVHGGRRQQTAALLVDEIGNLVRVSESQLRRPAGAVNDKVSSLLRGTVERNDRILRVLSLDSLFESGDLQQLRM